MVDCPFTVKLPWFNVFPPTVRLLLIFTCPSLVIFSRSILFVIKIRSVFDFVPSLLHKSIKPFPPTCHSFLISHTVHSALLSLSLCDSNEKFPNVSPSENSQGSFPSWHSVGIITTLFTGASTWK